MREVSLIVAAAGHLAIAVLMMLGARRSHLAAPLALLCLVLSGSCLATLGDDTIGGVAFDVADAVLTSMTPPLALHVVLAFVGRARRARRPLAVAYLGFALLGASTLPALAVPAFRAWVDGAILRALFLVACLPTVAFGATVLVRHLAATRAKDERVRTRTFLLALAVGGVAGAIDVLAGVGFPAPKVGALGMLFATASLASLTMRLRLLDRNLSARSGLVATIAICVFVGGYFLLFRTFRGSAAPFAVGAALLTAVVFAFARELGARRDGREQRRAELAVLGRFAAQMTHDLRTPLTALLGAVDVLEDADDDATRREFASLAGEQARRIARMVDRYDRLARIELRRTTVSPSAVATRIARLHEGSGARVTVTITGDATVEADGDLLESALENVVRNAVEAAPEGEVRIAVSAGPEDPEVIFAVQDRGPGIPARVLERVFDDFYTTKASGSGLGLPFARRVLSAHGGDVEIASAEGEGTIVTLRLPRA